MSNVQSVLLETINEGSESHEFDSKDRFGRTIGACVRRCVEVWGPMPEGYQGGFRYIEPGTYFAWNGRATRVGKSYGATQSNNRCTTEAERHAQIERYLAGARKRAAKAAQ